MIKDTTVSFGWSIYIYVLLRLRTFTCYLYGAYKIWLRLSFAGHISRAFESFIEYVLTQSIALSFVDGVAAVGTERLPAYVSCFCCCCWCRCHMSFIIFLHRLSRVNLVVRCFLRFLLCSLLRWYSYCRVLTTPMCFSYMDDISAGFVDIEFGRRMYWCNLAQCRWPLMLFDCIISYHWSSICSLYGRWLFILPNKTLWFAIILLCAVLMSNYAM